MSALIALILDAILGEPRWIWSRISHPAVLMGQGIEWAQKRLNHGQNRRAKGVLMIALLVLTAIVIGVFLSQFGPVVEGIIAAILLAQRSLVDHVTQVARDLRYGLPAGRRAVARIVGRDTGDMDAPAITRAAIESGAENFSDGVVAPFFWFLIGGLPGIIAYKMINTADSMVGYKTPDLRDFGWAAARLDDLVNWIPARLSAILILLTQGRVDILTLRMDAKKHRSPNAGWPEAAMARALNIALSGPRSYDGVGQDFPYVNPQGRKDVGPQDIDKSVKILWRAWAIMAIAGLFFALIWG